MAQPIQIRRKINGAGVPVSLAPGELAYNTTGNTLVIGDSLGVVQHLIGATRQVEIAGAQIVTGVKTIAVANIKITGGNANDVLKTDGAGNLAFVPAASTAQVFVGSFNATAGTITWTAGTGSGNTLPAAAAGNNGWYLICNVAGSTPPGAAPAGAYASGDWLLSNGANWTHVALGGASGTTASQVGVAPTIAGGDDVQEVLATLDADITNIEAVNTAQATAIAAKADKAYVDAGDATKVTGPASATGDDIAVFDGATGKLVKDSGTSVTAINGAIAAKANTADVYAKADVYTKTESDGRYVNASGDTLSGSLTISGGNVLLDSDRGLVWGGSSLRMDTASPTFKLRGPAGDFFTMGPTVMAPVTAGAMQIGSSGLPFSHLFINGVVDILGTQLARNGSLDFNIGTNIIYRAGGTDVAVADGGTGASSAAAALTNLGGASKAYVDGLVGGAYTKAEADAKFVDAVGDTMTGSLTASGQLISGSSAAARTTIAQGSITLRYDSASVAPCQDYHNDAVTSVNQGIYLARAYFNSGYDAGQIAVLSTGDFSGSLLRSTKLRFVSAQAQVLTAEVDIGNGVVVGAPTGGAKGVGTVNATAVYDDNAILSCYVLEAFRTGKVDTKRWDKIAPKGEHKRAREFSRHFADTLDVRSYTRAWRNTGVLPGMPTPASADEIETQPVETLPLGEWVSVLAEQVELHAGYIEQLTVENDAQTDIIAEQAAKIAQLETALTALTARMDALEA